MARSGGTLAGHLTPPGSMREINGDAMRDTSPRLYISKTTRYEVLRRDNFACRYCGLPSRVSPLHIDHVIPVSQGGTNDRWNLTAACADCNLGKSDGMPTAVVIYQVREDEALYERSKGVEVRPCDRCGIPQPYIRCDPCCETAIYGYEAGWAAAERLWQVDAQ